MYTLASFDRFEDQFVVSDELIEFDKLSEAVNELINQCNELIADKSSTQHIDEYISEELQPYDFEEEFGDCSKGFTRNILINDEEIISISINYDYKTKEKYFENVDIEKNRLDANSLDHLNKFLKIHKYEL